MDVATGTAQSSVPEEHAGIVRRVGAMIYDGMLMIAVLLIATLPFDIIAIINKKLLIPSEVGWWIYGLFLGWIMLVIILFFGFFWTRRGQTLGMQVWRLKVEDEEGKLLSWRLALRRLLSAALPWIPGYACLMISEQRHSSTLKWTGEGLLLLVLLNLIVLRFSSDHRTWHDRLSRSRVVLCRKRL